jgi:putative endonuclease
MHRQYLGQHGETLVIQFLQKNGFTICAHNYRKFFGEIDIIARKHNLYAFVEVKTRTRPQIAMGSLISRTKQIKISKTAQTFIAEHQLTNIVIRFDVALVSTENETYKLEYIENAFIDNQSGYDSYYGY